MDGSWFDEWATRLETVGGWLVAVGGGCVVGWKWIARAVRAAVAADSLALEAGTDFAQIRQLLDAVSRSQSETELRQNIVEKQLGIGIYEFSPDGRCTFANDALCDMFGVDAAKMVGYGWLDGIVDQDRTRIFEQWQLAVQHRLPYRASYTVINRRTDEEIGVHNTQAFPCYTATGELVCYVGWVIPDEG